MDRTDFNNNDEFGYISNERDDLEGKLPTAMETIHKLKIHAENLVQLIGETEQHLKEIHEKNIPPLQIASRHQARSPTLGEIRRLTEELFYNEDLEVTRRYATGYILKLMRFLSFNKELNFPEYMSKIQELRTIIFDIFSRTGYLPNSNQKQELDNLIPIGDNDEARRAVRTLLPLMDAIKLTVRDLLRRMLRETQYITRRFLFRRQ
ncbi:hypothetical protein ACTXT7_004235 [Hymenolepis weldensis]